MSPGFTELIITLAIVLVLFGSGRIARMAAEFRAGRRSFRQGLEGIKKNDPRK